MKALSEVLTAIEPFDAAIIEERVKAEIEQRGWNMGAVMNAWRLLLVGDLKGPSLFKPRRRSSGKRRCSGELNEEPKNWDRICYRRKTNM
jgi:hypothetical protein